MSLKTLKMDIQHFVALLAVVIAQCFTNAYATLPTPKDVSNAVEVKNYTLAEQMLRQITNEKPDNARAHYNLGQVLAFQHHNAEALTELNRARELDPTLKFAASKNTFTTIYKEIQLKVEPPPTINQTAQSTTQQITIAQQPTHQQSGVGVFFALLGVVIVIIGGFATFQYYQGRKTERETRDQRKKVVDNTLKTALDLSESTKNLRLLIRASKHSESDRNKFLERLDCIKQNLLNTICELRADTPHYYNNENLDRQVVEQSHHLTILDTDVAKSPAEPQVTALIQPTNSTATLELPASEKVWYCEDVEDYQNKTKDTNQHASSTSKCLSTATTQYVKKPVAHLHLL